jgi:hypothetical protein
MDNRGDSTAQMAHGIKMQPEVKGKEQGNSRNRTAYKLFIPKTE